MTNLAQGNYLESLLYWRQKEVCCISRCTAYFKSEVSFNELED